MKLTQWQKKRQRELQYKEQRTLAGEITEGEQTMESRTISGTIDSWEQTTGQKGPYLKAEIDGQKYNFFKPRDNSGLESYTKNAPVGSTVEFVQTKNGSYWNNKEGTFKVLSKATAQQQAQTPTASPASKPAIATSNTYWEEKTKFEMQKFKRDEEMEPLWTFLRCIESACASTKIDLTKIKQEDFKSAGKIAADPQVRAVLDIANAFFYEAQSIKRKAAEAKKIMASIENEEVLEAVENDII